MAHTTDPLERMMAECLDRNHVHYTRPDKDKYDKSNLDFYLVVSELSIEVKAWSCERLHDQLRNSGREKDGVIVLIGEQAVKTFCALVDHAQKY